ncbi:hypothetical protein [Pseudoalteromonas sp. T1lg48]|uniref:hypothetical protein n=1 Tax=Pseudoalteromonas sp. T1lg48 TaxID=2077100 RepID=UPI000CF61711|nr:hypothetical protein [Pseudoalteromonas sp. T1lg48]
MLSQVESWLNELEVIAKGNKANANASGQKYIWYSAQKNKDIKSKFADKCERLSTDARQFKARSSGDGGSGGEWLYDFTLWEFSGKNLIGIPLVAEIEMSDSKSGGLVYDFNKLLQSDADNKVFIFQQKSKSGFCEILKDIEAAIKNYAHKVPSEYLVSCWIMSEYKFLSKRVSVSRS